MKKFAYYSDLFFTFSLTSFVSLFLLRFFGTKLSIALIPSLCLGAVSSILLSFHLRKKQRVFALKKSEEAEKDALLLYLRLTESQEVAAFLQARLPLLTGNLSPANVSVDSKQSIPNEVLRYEDFFFLPYFFFRDITADDIAQIAKKLRGIPNVVLLCDKLSEQAKDLCDKLSFHVIQGDELYRILKDADELSQNSSLSFPAIKVSRKRILFAKNNSKRFFKSGVLLSVCSFFTPFAVYYAVSACLFFTISLFVRIFGYR